MLRAQQRLDRAALVQGAALGHLAEGQGQVEDPTRVDRSAPDQTCSIGNFSGQ
jgi:hypothetical protein